MYYSPYRGGSYPSVYHGMYSPPQPMYWQPPQQPNQQQSNEQSTNEQRPEQSKSNQNQQPTQPYPYHFSNGYGGPGYPPPYPRPGSGFLNAFKTKDGKFDFDKASTTLDQVVNLGNQISPIVKQVGGLFRK